MDLGKLKNIANSVVKSVNGIGGNSTAAKPATKPAAKPTAKPIVKQIVTMENGIKCELEKVPLGEVYTKVDGTKARKVIKMPEKIDTMAAMKGLLGQLAPATTPAMNVLLQNQLQVLDSVQNASMTLMAIDTMVFSLSKALQKTNNEDEKTTLRDNFSMLIQSFLFFTEAKLMYAIDTNKQEALNLLSEAGDMLSQCMSEAAFAAVGASQAAGKKIVDKVSTIAVKNVFATKADGTTFLGKFMQLLGNKKIVEDKKLEFEKMVRDMFITFDNCADIIGPSILINNLLLRYANDLALKYETKKFTGLGDRVSTFAPKRTLLLKKADMDADFVRLVIADVTSDERAARIAYEHEQEELKDYQEKLKKAGLFAHSRKEELRVAISQQEKDIKVKRDRWEIFDMRKQKMDQLLAPINADVDAFRRKYIDIANKYAVNTLTINCK